MERLLSSHCGRCGVRHGPRRGGCGNFHTGRTTGYVYREGGRPDFIHLGKACRLQFRGDGQSAEQPHQPSWKPSSLVLGRPVHEWRGAPSHPCGGDAVVRAHSLPCSLHEGLGAHGAQGVWGSRQRGSRRRRIRRRKEKASQETWTRQRTRWKRREAPWGPKATCSGQEWGSPQRSQRSAAREASGPHSRRS